MADMIKFYKGLEANLPASGVNGALYITTDEGAIYLGTGTSMKRLGDFVQVANVAALPTKAHENCLYYCVAENILAKWNGSEWKQVNKQPTVEEMKELLGLGSIAYLSEVSESNLSSALKEKVNAAAEGNHAHSNKTVLDGISAEKVADWDDAVGKEHTHSNKDLLDSYTQTEANLADAVAKKHSHSFVETELNKIADGDVAKWHNKVDKEAGKALIAETEIARLAAMSDGANKVTASSVNGSIQIDGVDTVVYTHPDKHSISDVSGLQDAINAKQDVIPANTYDTYGAASSAESNAKSYADSLASNYDASGSAATAEQNAKNYADGLAGNYDAVGSAATAESNAKSYADGLASNYDAAGSAADAEANAKAYVDSEDIFHTDIVTVNALGGIAAGADLNGMTTHEILNTLLFPYVAFTINSTSRSAAAATLENGDTQTLSSASISITKKSKPITSVKLLNGSEVLGEKTGDAVAAGGTIKFENLGITVSKSNNPNLKFTVTDGQTSTDKNVGASTFVYPYYMGECAADATINETLIEGLTKKVESKGNKTVTHTMSNGRMVIAYPKAHGVLKSILDPNNFETIGDYTRSEVSITGLDGTAQAYYVYASGAATVNGFKVQYKY